MMKPYKIKHKKPFIKLLLYSKPGIGKTSLAAEAQNNPDLADVLFINIENGLLTLTDDRVQAIDIGRKEDGTSNGNIIGDLEKIVFALAGKQPGFEKIKTVVVDGTSELQTRDLEDIVVKGSVLNGSKHDIDARIQQDYGTDTNRLKRVFRQLKDLSLNVIFTAIEKNTMEGNGPNSRVIEVSPALTDKVKEALMAMVDFVWYLYKDEKGNRVLLTEEKGIFRAKTRNEAFFKAIGQKVENPKLSELYNILCKVVGNES